MPESIYITRLLKPVFTITFVTLQTTNKTFRGRHGTSSGRTRIRLRHRRGRHPRRRRTAPWSAARAKRRRCRHRTSTSVWPWPWVRVSSSGRVSSSRNGLWSGSPLTQSEQVNIYVSTTLVVKMTKIWVKTARTVNFDQLSHQGSGLDFVKAG